MPPRFAYWTILAGGLPTAFRAAERDDLMPTFQRIREKHPDAEMKWFARGKLWNSPEEARSWRKDGPMGRTPNERGSRGFGRSNDLPRPKAAADSHGSSPKNDEGRPRPGGADETRGRDWRPGGVHRDPRQKYADAKKARNADSRKRRFERKHGDAPSGGSDHSSRPDSFRGQGGAPRKDAWRDRPPSHAKSASSYPNRNSGPKGDWRDRPRVETKAGTTGFRSEHGAAPRKDAWRDRPPSHAKGASSHPNRGSGPKGDWRDRPRAEPKAGTTGFRSEHGAAPRKDAWRDRPPSHAKGASSHPNRGSGPKGDWRDRPRAEPKAGTTGFRGEHRAAPRKDSWRDRTPRQEGWRDHATANKNETSATDRRGAPKGDWRDRPRSDAKTGAGFRGGPGSPARKDSWRDQQPRKDGWRERPPTTARNAAGSNDRRETPKGDSRDRSRGDTRPHGAFGAGKGGGKRPFARGGFNRHGGSEEPTPREQRPKSPNREPRPSENPEPTPPPRPSEPAIAPQGPPERGRRKGPRTS